MVHAIDHWLERGNQLAGYSVEGRNPVSEDGLAGVGVAPRMNAQATYARPAPTSMVDTVLLAPLPDRAVVLQAEEASEA
jgi:hypothetical protein